MTIHHHEAFPHQQRDEKRELTPNNNGAIYVSVYVHTGIDRYVFKCISTRNRQISLGGEKISRRYQ